jgi:hypothetical protein
MQQTDCMGRPPADGHRSRRGPTFLLAHRDIERVVDAL